MCDECRQLESEIELLWGVVALLARRTGLRRGHPQHVLEKREPVALLTPNGELIDGWPPVPMNPQLSPSGSLQLEGRVFRLILSRRMREWEHERTRPLLKRRKKR